MPKHYEIHIGSFGVKIIQRASGSSMLEALEKFLREDDAKATLIEADPVELVVRRV